MKKKRIRLEDINKDRLNHHLQIDHLSNVAIGELFGCSSDFIAKATQHYGLTPPTISQIAKAQFDKGRKVNCKIEDVPTKEDIEYLYLERKMPLIVVSMMLDTSIPTLKKWLKSYSIPQRSHSEQQMLQANPKRTSISQIGLEAHECLNNRQWMEEAYQHHSSERISQILNVSSTIVLRHIHQHNLDIRNRYASSPMENEIVDYIKSIYPGTVIQSDRSLIAPYEVDIHIPAKKLAIEFNGIYWHSQQQGKDKKYHITKTNACESQGVQLLHVFENEWVDETKREIWQSVIANKLGIHIHKIGARQTKIVRIGKDELNRFLEKNHLQGPCPSQMHRALEFGSRIVAVMSFGPARYTTSSKWELLRYAVLRGFSVMGGASKLLTHFRRAHHGTIISYANRRWSTGNLYEKLGFAYSHKSDPNYFYWNNPMILHSRLHFQKHKLPGKINIYDENLSEYENMLNNGYDRIFDCGNIAYQYKA